MPVAVRLARCFMLLVYCSKPGTAIAALAKAVYTSDMAGYSKRSLRDKLGIKPGMRLYFYNAPHSVFAELGDLDDDTTTVADPVLANYFHYFVTTHSELQTIAETLQHLRAPGQIAWVSWRKQSSHPKSHNSEGEISEQNIRDALLPIGLVDVKVAAIDDRYSALKFVWRVT